MHNINIECTLAANSNMYCHSVVLWVDWKLLLELFPFVSNKNQRTVGIPQITGIPIRRMLHDAIVSPSADISIIYCR